MPIEKHLLTVIPIGYPAEKGASKRKELKKFVYLNKYKNTYPF